MGLNEMRETIEVLNLYKLSYSYISFGFDFTSQYYFSPLVDYVWIMSQCIMQLLVNNLHTFDLPIFFTFGAQSIAEKLQSDVPVALKVAFDDLKVSDYKTRDTSIDDIYKYDKVELSVLLCDDNFIQKLNKEWRDVDQATDVLSMSQHIPELDLPIVRCCSSLSCWLCYLLVCLIRFLSFVAFVG